jgi:hypothetical protein
MKYLFLSLVIVTNLSYAQEPPKKANKIIVLTKDSANTLISKIAIELFNRGFTIDTKDEALKQITTKERPNKNSMTLIKIRAMVNDTAIIFTSQMALANEYTLMGVTMKPTFDPVTYSGMKKGYMMEAWRELDAIAHEFGDKITYSK